MTDLERVREDLELMADAIATPSGTLVDCPRCSGDGTIDFNPSWSCPPDPQMEQSARCPDCSGAGTRLSHEIEIARLRRALEDIATAAADVIVRPAVKWPMAFVTWALDTAQGALDG